MNMPDFLAGGELRRRLETALSRMSHAYMISGSTEEDRRALANYLASACVCTGGTDGPCGVCTGCRKVREGIHPDVICVSVPQGKREITVEQIRQLRAGAYIRPNEGRRKVFIIETAQAMNDNAQNALLKVLEDGPGYLSFLLLAENPQQLLPTIRSRCESIAIPPREEEEHPALSEELLQQAARLAGLLLSRDERALVECTISLENQKLDRDTLAAFVDAVQEALRPELTARPRQVLPLMEHLDKIRKAAWFNVGTGHLLGFLAAAR